MQTVSVVPSPIRGDQAKIEFQGIGQRRDTFSASRVFADDNCFSPAKDIVPDPPGDQWFGMQVVNWLAEESLTWRSLRS